MKTIAAAALIALLGVGSASADIYGEEGGGYHDSWSQPKNLSSLPATSASPNKPQDEFIHQDDDHG